MFVCVIEKATVQKLHGGREEPRDMEAEEQRPMGTSKCYGVIGRMTQLVSRIEGREYRKSFKYVLS